MASSYPSSADALSNPASGDALSTGHAAQHANANDAIEAIEATLGLNPQGGSATVKARFDAIEANSWVTSARIADGTITGTDIASGTVTSTNILDGTIVNADINASAAIDVSKLSGVVTSAGVGNLLTANQATIETDTTGFNNPFQCTLARSTAQYVSGAASLAATATSTSFAFFTPLGTSGVPVAPGQVYTVSASVKAGGNSTDIYIGIHYYNGSTSLGETTTYKFITSSGWTRILHSAVAPSNATHAAITVSSGTVTNGDVFYFDQFGLWSGAGGVWRAPGVVIPNLGTYTDESVGRRIFTWDTVNNRYQMTFGDTGWRDVKDDANLGPATANGWSAYSDTWRVRRVGSAVYVVIQATRGASITSKAFTGVWPVGWRPLTAHTVPMQIAAGTTVMVGWQNQIANCWDLDFWGSGLSNGSIVYFYTNYLTPDAWPTSLPGTAVGSIPQ